MSTAFELMGLGMPPTLANRLGNTPATIAGIGTTQTGAALIAVPVVIATAADASHMAFVLSNALSTGRPVWVWNTSAVTIMVFPPSGGSINGGAANGGIAIPASSGALFQLYSGEGIAAETWGCILGSGPETADSIPQQVYNAVATAPTANNLNLTGANITGASSLVAMNLTAVLGAGATATLPTVAALVTAMQAAGLDPVAGATYELDIYNTSSGAFSWTTTTNTGWTLAGTAQTIAQNTVRKYVVTLTSLTAAVLQSLGQFAFSGAP